MPAKISAYIRATRAGVSRRPSRSGSSPIAARISRTAAAMRGWSMAPPRTVSATQLAAGALGAAPRRRLLRGAVRRPSGAAAAVGAAVRTPLQVGHVTRPEQCQLVGREHRRDVLRRAPPGAFEDAGRAFRHRREDLGEL